MTKPVKGEPNSIFARPTEPPSNKAVRSVKLVSAWRPASGLTLAALVAVTCAVFLLQSRQNGAQNLPAVQNKKIVVPSRKPVRVAMAERDKAVDKSTESSRPALELYTRGVRGSMFSAPQPPQPKETPPPKPPKPPVVKVAAINPFLDWNYAGTVSVGDKKMALLENRTSKEGHYVQEGQTFMDATVKSVTDQMVTLSASGKPYLLAKSDTVNVTPLTSSAGYLSPQAQQQQQQQAAQTQNAQMLGWQQMMMSGQYGQGMMLPNGRYLDPNRATRFNNRMNSRFDGGGGGRGGRGGGGQNGGQGGGRGGRGGGGGVTMRFGG